MDPYIAESIATTKFTPFEKKLGQLVAELAPLGRLQDARGLVEGVAGKNLLTHQPLSSTARTLSLISALPFIPLAIRDLAPEAVKLSKTYNLIYNGVQEGIGKIPSMHLWTDPKTRSTFATLSLDADEVKKALASTRRRFAK